MSDQSTANAYLRTRVMSASQEELRLMLLDGAVKFARQGRDAIARADAEARYSGFSQCRAIVLELMKTIQAEPAPELAEKVRSLYAFIYSELVDANHEADLGRLDKVIGLLEYERETWALLMEKTAEDRQSTPAAGSSGAGVAAGVSAGQALQRTGTDGAAPGGFSIQG